MWRAVTVSHKQCRKVEMHSGGLRNATFISISRRVSHKELKVELLKLKTADFTRTIPSLTQVWEVSLVNTQK